MGILDDFGKVVSDTYKSATKTSGKIIEEGKLKLLIMDNESAMKEIYQSIGKEYCETYFKGELLNNDKFQNEFDELKRMKLENNQAQERLLELKSVRKCTNCDKEIDLNSTFCHYCGTKQPDYVPTKQDNEEENIADVKIEAESVEEVIVSEIQCKNCNANIKSSDDFCPNCGAKIE